MINIIENIIKNGDIFRVTIPLNKSQNTQDNTQDKSKNTQDNTQDNIRKKVDEQSILVFCVKERSIKEIIEYFGYKNAKSFRKKYINPLINKGLLSMTIPDKPTSRNQKYISKDFK